MAADARASKVRELFHQEPSSAASTAVRTDLVDVFNEPDATAEAPEGCPYVVNTLHNGKLHIINKEYRQLTYCRWNWQPSRNHIQSHSRDGFDLCRRCILLEAAHGSADPGGASSSSASDSSEDES